MTVIQGWRQLKDILIVISYYIIGVLFYKYSEEWLLIDCLYFITVTTFSVGYGDFHPTNFKSRLFTIFFAIFGISFILNILSNIGSHFIVYLESRAVSTFDEKPSTSLFTHFLRACGVVAGVVIIIFIGSAVISNLEGWTFLDAVYFSVITGSCVGYGDITPKHPGSKIFVIVYMYVLIVVIMLVLGFLASMRRNIAMDRRKVEILNRPVDLAWLSELGSDDGIDKCVFVFGVLEQLGIVNLSDVEPWVRRFDALDVDHNKILTKDDIVDRDGLAHRTIIMKLDKTAKAYRSSMANLTKVNWRTYLFGAPMAKIAPSDILPSSTSSAHDRSTTQQSASIFASVPTNELILHWTIPKVHNPRTSDSLWQYLVREGVLADFNWEWFINSMILWGIIAVYFVSGYFFYHIEEGWSAIECCYFISITMTTTGYGDYHPTTANSKLFTIFFIIFGLMFVLSNLINFVSNLLAVIEERSRLAVGIEGTFGTDKMNHRLMLLVSFSCILLTLAVGLIGFRALEGWGVFDCLYFCVISTLTIGYGESHLIPSSGTSRLFCTFYVGISVLLVSASIGNIVSIRAETVLAEEVKRRLHLELDVDLILELGHGKAGVNKYEFVAGILDQLGLINKVLDADPWAERFDELDIDKSGYLDKEDILAIGDLTGGGSVTLSSKVILSTISQSAKLSPSPLAAAQRSARITSSRMTSSRIGALEVSRKRADQSASRKVSARYTSPLSMHRTQKETQTQIEKQTQTQTQKQTQTKEHKMDLLRILDEYKDLPL